MWPDLAGRRNGRLASEKERALCQHSHMQPVTALMPTDWNAGHRKWQYVAAIPTYDTANYRLAV